jgi:hypothetical protein
VNQSARTRGKAREEAEEDIQVGGVEVVVNGARKTRMRSKALNERRTAYAATRRRMRRMAWRVSRCRAGNLGYTTTLEGDKKRIDRSTSIRVNNRQTSQWLSSSKGCESRSRMKKKEVTGKDLQEQGL